MISRRPLLFGAAAAGLTATMAKAQTASGFEGEWNGDLHTPGGTLRLHLVIGAGPVATMFSVDQGNARIPAAEVHIDGAVISMTFPAVNASYTGSLANGRISGQFTQGARLPLDFTPGPLPTGAAPPAPPPLPLEHLTQDVLRGLRVQSGAPALAAAARSTNHKSVSLADGLRSAAGSTQVTPNDQWHLGSMTKSMTATLVARMVDAGHVSWDDTVGAVLGSAIPDMRAEYRDVNFRHLLSHRAGLQGNIPMDQLGRFQRENPDPRQERIAWSRIALKMAPVGPKETTFTYANNGFIIAGTMLEVKLGKKWEDLITEQVFAPLGMNSAGFGAPGTPGRLDQPVGHAQGASGPHTPYPPGGAISDNPAALGPAGRVHASLDDVLKFCEAHRDRTALLKPETWDTLHTPPFGGDYAMGWVKVENRFWHNGSNTLFYSEMTFDPQTGVVCAAACNDGNVDAVQTSVRTAMRDAGFTVI
ncbi:MAG: serine hydrolase domain-containing protein [Terricaulis sp.]